MDKVAAMPAEVSFMGNRFHSEDAFDRNSPHFSRKDKKGMRFEIW
jgi:hypothetical protein